MLAPQLADEHEVYVEQVIADHGHAQMDKASGSHAEAHGEPVELEGNGSHTELDGDGGSDANDNMTHEAAAQEFFAVMNTALANVESTLQYRRHGFAGSHGQRGGG